MKTIKILSVLLTAFLFSAYAQEKSEDVKQMLKNPKTQEAIFQSILNDSDLTTKFLNTMMETTAKDSVVCHHVCSTMMNDEHMANAIASKIIELQSKQEAKSLEERKKQHIHRTIPGKN